MLRIFDRYIVREVVSPFLLAFLIFTFMLMMSPIERVAGSLLDKDVSGSVVLEMLALLLPQALALTIPIAFLLGLLVAFGRLSGDSEWVAMQACGVRLTRLLRPVLAFGVLTWAATQWVLVSAVPWANQAFREIEFSVVKAHVESEVKPRVFFTKFPGVVLYARDLRQGAPGWSDVFVALKGQGPLPFVYTARTGRIDIDNASQRMMLRLEHGTSHNATGEDKYQGSTFDDLTRELDGHLVSGEANLSKGDQEMTVAELQQRAREREKELDLVLQQQRGPMDESTRRHTDGLRVEVRRARYYVHFKFAVPAACFVFALLGLGLGVGTNKGGKLAAFALGSAVLFTYYIVMFQTRSLAMGGRLPSWAAAWLPNIILGLAGVVLLVLRVRSSGQSLRVAIPTPAFLRRRGRAAGASAGHQASRSVVVVVRVPPIPLPQVGILDRYVVRAYLRIQVLAFFSLLGIFYIGTFIDLSDKLFSGKATGQELALYFLYATPQFVYYVVPLSVLIATLVTVGALIRNSELIVMRACGISLYRTAVPVLVAAGLYSLLLFGLGERILARANSEADELNEKIRSGTIRTSGLHNQRWVVGRDGAIYYYEYFDPREKVLHGVSKFEFSQQGWQIVRMWFSRTIRFDRAHFPADAAAGPWIAKEGWVRELNPNGEARSFQVFRERQVLMEPPDYFGTEQPIADLMSYGELSRYIDEMRASGLNVLPPLVKLHQKIAFPFVTIVMTLLAVPFAVMTGRRGALYGVGIAICLSMLYWTLTTLFGIFGSTDTLPPLLAAWAPNLFFGAGAIYLLLTVRT